MLVKATKLFRRIQERAGSRRTFNHGNAINFAIKRKTYIIIIIIIIIKNLRICI